MWWLFPSSSKILSSYSMKERVKIKCQRCLLKMEFIANPRLKHLCKPKVEVVVQIQGSKVQSESAQKSEPPGSCPNHQVEIDFCGQNAPNLQVHVWNGRFTHRIYSKPPGSFLNLGLLHLLSSKVAFKSELSAITSKSDHVLLITHFSCTLLHFVAKKHAWRPRIIQLQIRVLG